MQNFVIASKLNTCSRGLPRATRIPALAISMALFALLATAAAQDEPQGIDSGNYHYQGSFELGYRFVNTLGSQNVYDTFVNQQQGPRLLDQTLNVRSLDHEGGLFDTLFLSSFGWGGDPENASRLRMSKNKLYNFNMTFRRDRNFWDYNDLANPLNPPNTFIQNNNSPHEMQTVRRMYDYNLVLLPQSVVRVRLGFSRNNNEGPAFSTIHEGTDTMLFQNTRTLLDAYQIGVDVKLLPRTSISYDEFLQYYKGDSTWNDQNFQFQLSNGSPVDAGIDYNPTANQPCSNTPTPIFSAGTPPVLRSTCSAIQAYSRAAPVRISYPTEQLTLQSSYFKRFDISARGSYSSAQDTANNFDETFLGLGRNNLRGSDVTGSASARRVVANVDLATTIHLTEHLRLVDTFRFSNFRIPGLNALNTLNLFPGSSPASLLLPVVPYNPSTCNPVTSAGCPSHTGSSAADLSATGNAPFLGQDSKTNTFEVEYDFGRHFGTHVGYRFGHRTISQNGLVTSLAETFDPSNALRGDCKTGTVDANGVCTFSSQTVALADTLEINEHSALFGFWAHPTDHLRANFDMELFSADNAPTRISPRNLQHYKGRINYKAKSWLNFSGSVNMLESRDNVTDILHREHNRNYGFTADFQPKPRFGFELGYNYEDVFSTTNICYILTSAPPVNSTACGSGSPYFSAVSLYKDRVNYAYTNFMFKPAPRVAMRVGYDLTSSAGATPTLADPTVIESLGFNYHRPTAALDVDLTKGLTWRTAWGYYDYNEKFLPAPLSARDFQSNSATLSVVYAY